MFKKFFYVFLLSPMMLLVGCNKDARPIPPLEEPLHFTCTSGEVLVECRYTGYYVENEPNLEWSNNKKEWRKIIIDDPIEPLAITNLKKEQTIYFRGNNPNGFCHIDELNPLNNSYLTFGFSTPKGEAKINLEGNIMSLLSANEFKDKIDIPCSGCFNRLFCGNFLNEIEIDASNLLLPATELQSNTYVSTFQYANIVKAPKDLPAKVAKENCYYAMFCADNLLLTAPIIHLENLKNGSCSCMFWQCSNLNISKDNTGTEFFTCPDLTGLDDSVEKMFAETGSYIDDPQTGEVFYFN